MAKELDEGDPAPDFALPTDGGGQTRLADLKGKPVVLYFYPKDDTSGCTAEAIAFSGLRPASSQAAGAAWSACRPTARPATTSSRPSTTSPSRWPRTPSGSAIEAYGVWKEKSMYGRKYFGVERTTFLIGRDGRIAKVWRKVKVPKHAEEVLAAVKAL